MPIQAAFLESVLKERRHQRLDVGQRGDALPEVARRQDPVLGAQPARATAVIRHRHDRGQVAGVLLQPPKESRESRTASQGDHAGPLLEEAVVVNDLGECPIAAWQEGAQDRLGQLVQGVADKAKAEKSEENGSVGAGDELERQRSDDLWEASVLVEVTQKVANPEADDHQTDSQKDQPSLDVEAGGEPAHHPGVHTYGGHRRPKLSTAFFELNLGTFRYIHWTLSCLAEAGI